MNQHQRQRTRPGVAGHETLDIGLIGEDRAIGVVHEIGRVGREIDPLRRRIPGDDPPAAAAKAAEAGEIHLVAGGRGHLATSGQVLSDSGQTSSSPGMVATMSR